MTFDENYFPHWSAWDAVTNRIVITPGRDGNSRLYLLEFDPQSGGLKIDKRFATQTAARVSTSKIVSGRKDGKDQGRRTELFSRGNGIFAACSCELLLG